ncbi:MAG: hypothetical protein JSS14_00500 [Proteobacteria bacterium]|nr:hypothetical protein [Pseudomonadota bacterium]
MHLVIIAWLYVALMMAVAEATNTTGTVLGAIFTFLLYGALPVAIIAYIMRAPVRRRARQAREQAAREAAMVAGAAAQAGASSSSALAPDQGSQAPADALAPIGKEP